MAAEELISNVLSIVNLANPLVSVTTLILSTVIGGIVFLLVLAVLSKKFSDNVKLRNAFIVVFFITLINLIGVLKLIPYINIIPVLAIQVVIWIIFTKLAFRGMAISHALIAGIVGWAITSFVVPTLVTLAFSFIKL